MGTWRPVPRLSGQIRVEADHRHRARRLRRWPRILTGRAAARAEESAAVADRLGHDVHFLTQVLAWMINGDRWDLPRTEGTSWYRLAQLWDELVGLAALWQDDDAYDTGRRRGLQWRDVIDGVGAASRETDTAGQAQVTDVASAKDWPR